VIRPHLVNIAKEFWRLAGGIQEWPCDIERAVSILTPLNIVSLSDLSFNKIEEWFNNRNISFEVEYSERMLHGFISVHKDCGFIFINGTDPESERRYTVSHEVSHYFIDYKIPRERAITTYGKSIEEVLDGYREPTVEERVDSVLNSISIKQYTHILEKEGDGNFDRYNNWLSERDADALAVELLAPYKLVKKDFSKYSKSNLSFQECKIALMDILNNKYALPYIISSEYSSSIAATIIGNKNIIEKLGLNKK